MPINVFGNISNNSENGIDTSLFVQNPYLRSNYIEANIEEDIDLRNQYRIKSLPDHISIREAASKNYVDKNFNDPSIMKNTTHVDFNDKNLDNVRSIKVNSTPTLKEHLTPKYYVDNALFYSVDESSLVRQDPNENIKLDERGSILPNSTLTSPKTIIELPIKSYVDSLHEINRNRRDLSSVFNDQDIEFDNNKLTNLDSITVNGKPSSNNDLANKKYVDDSIGGGNISRFNPTLQTHLKVSVGNDIYKLIK